MDIQALLQRIDLRALAEEAGAVFRNGGYSRCPLHQGDNPTAFHLYRGDNGIWRWHCFTRCPKGQNDGDAIGFYMRWRSVDFKTALEELARRAGMGEQQAGVAVGMDDPPSPQWQARALAFWDYTCRQLWSTDGARSLRYLREERGLNDDTILAWGLGWNPRDYYDLPERWGLKLRGKRVWLPAGIVIPGFREGALWYVKVRRFSAQPPKYMGITGGRSCLFGVDHLRGREVLLLCEGEFDAMLAWQECGDLVDVATLGGAAQRPRAIDMPYLLRARRIIAAYDSDAAGASGRAALMTLSSRVVPVTPPAKDVTELYTSGGRDGLREWVEKVRLVAGGHGEP